MRGLRVLLLVCSCFGIAASGCRHCDETYQEADDFLSDPTNLECAVDEDCLVEVYNCAELDVAYCGQVTLSKTAAASSEWRDIRVDLRSCGKGSSCTVCDAALVPTCAAGHCSSPNL